MEKKFFVFCVPESKEFEEKQAVKNIFKQKSCNSFPLFLWIFYSIEQKQR